MTATFSEGGETYTCELLDELIDDGPVECAGCNRIFPESALYYGKCDTCYEASDDAELDALKAQYDVDESDYWELGGVVSDADSVL